MSTGLAFGTISALYGLSHGTISQEQNFFLVATVIASAIIPTLIASYAFLPKYLLHLRKKLSSKVTEYGIDEE
jgi:Kef-type K+ transport system membrane component KefB